MPIRKLFFSYRNSPTDVPKADRIAEQLRQECFPNTTDLRYDVWQDKHSLPRATPHWWDEIVKAIEACDVLIFALSEDSLSSPFCLAELNYAYRRCRPIVPVVLEGEHVRVAGKHDVKQSNKAKIPDWLSNHQYIFDGVDNPCSEINAVVDRYERKGFPPDTKVTAPLDPTKEAVYASPHKLYQAAVTYAEQQAFTDAERCFHELVTRQNKIYEADSRTWIEIIDAYKELLEMDHPATRRQFEEHKEAYQKRKFINGIFDPRGLFTAPASPVPPTPMPSTPPIAVPVTPAVNPKTAWVLAKNLDAKGFAELGRKLVWEDNNPEAGLVALDRAIALGEVGQRVYFNRANAYDSLGDYRTAIDNWDIAITLDPKDHDAYNNRGNAYRNLQQYEHAIKDYDRAIQIKPDYADAYYNRGNAYKNLQQYQRAIEDFDRSIQIRHDYANAYNNRGVAYYNLQQYQRAIQDYDRAIQHRQDYAYAYNNRGLAYNDLKQYQRAIEDYDRAIQIRHDFALAHNNRGAAYEHLGNMAQAKADYCKALQLDPSNEIARGNLQRKGWVC